MEKFHPVHDNLCESVSIHPYVKDFSWNLLCKYTRSCPEVLSHEDPKVWVVCAIFVASLRLFTESQIIGVPLSLLLRRADIRLYVFLGPLRIFVSQTQPAILNTVVYHLERHYVILTLLYEKYENVYQTLFHRHISNELAGVERGGAESLGVNGGVTTLGLQPEVIFRLGWTLFLLGKATLFPSSPSERKEEHIRGGTPASTDFVKSLHLLLGILNFLVIQIPPRLRKLSLEEMYFSLREKFPPINVASNDSDMKADASLSYIDPFEATQPGQPSLLSSFDPLLYLCVCNHANYHIVKEIQANLFNTWITTLCENGILHYQPAKLPPDAMIAQVPSLRVLYLGGLLDSSLGKNARMIDHEYELLHFEHCHFDERLFATHAQQLKSPMRVRRNHPPSGKLSGMVEAGIIGHSEGKHIGKEEKTVGDTIVSNNDKIPSIITTAPEDDPVPSNTTNNSTEVGVATGKSSYQVPSDNLRKSPSGVLTPSKAALSASDWLYTTLDHRDEGIGTWVRNHLNFPCDVSDTRNGENVGIGKNEGTASSDMNVDDAISDLMEWEWIEKEVVWLSSGLPAFSTDNRHRKVQMNKLAFLLLDRMLKHETLQAEAKLNTTDPSRGGDRTANDQKTNESGVILSLSTRKTLVHLVHHPLFLRSLILACLEIISHSYRMYSKPHHFPDSLKIFNQPSASSPSASPSTSVSSRESTATVGANNLTPFHFNKIIETMLKHLPTLPPSQVKHLLRIEERILEELGWISISPLFSSLSRTNVRRRLGEQLRALGTPQKPRHNACNVFSSPYRHRFPLNSANSLEKSAEDTDTKVSSSVEVFLRKVSHLASLRLRLLCKGLVEQAVVAEKAHNGFTKGEEAPGVHLRGHTIKQIEYSLIFVITQHPGLMRNRHLDQILICVLYGVCKATKVPLTFRQIVTQYLRQPHAKLTVCQVVRLLRGNVGSVVQFYNTVFLETMEDYLLSLSPSEDDIITCDPNGDERDNPVSATAPSIDSFSKESSIGVDDANPSFPSPPSSPYNDPSLARPSPLSAPPSSTITRLKSLTNNPNLQSPTRPKPVFPVPHTPPHHQPSLKSPPLPRPKPVLSLSPTQTHILSPLFLVRRGNRGGRGSKTPQKIKNLLVSPRHTPLLFRERQEVKLGPISSPSGKLVSINERVNRNTARKRLLFGGDGTLNDTSKTMRESSENPPTHNDTDRKDSSKRKFNDAFKERKGNEVTTISKKMKPN